ncbi:hypothetical protein FHX77_000861 [Bifidobacterium commune]|nr:ATP-binding protein [Bifidobacterium commune]MBB2955445.1 hypothetical protein [Bifidobacterium commune]
MTTATQYSLDVLGYWCAVELFSPQSWKNPQKINLRQSVGHSENTQYQNLPWEDLRADMFIGLTQRTRSSFEEQYSQVKFGGGYHIQTNMQARLQQPLSFIESTETWLKKQNAWPYENNSPIQTIIQQAHQEWLELTYGSETLPTGSFVSDALIGLLVDTMENLAHATNRSGRVQAIYLKNYPHKYREKPYYMKANPPKDASAKNRKTSAWLHHEYFCIQVGLSQQVVFNALHNASTLIREFTPAEKVREEETLPSSSTRDDAKRYTLKKTTASMMCFEVRDDGTLGPDSSLAISQYAKAVSCLFAHNCWPTCPTGWPDIKQLDDNERRIRIMFSELVGAVAPDGSPRRVSRNTLNYIIDAAANELGLDDKTIRQSPVYEQADGNLIDRDSVSCRLVKGGDANESPLMDSFYISDLEALYNIKCQEIASGSHTSETFSEPLKRYLSQTHPERFDLTEDPDGALLDKLTQPNRIPDGRWPSKSNQFQSTAQQLAINQITATANSGQGDYLLGVNGPPGTGKTTLLKDVISEIIVARASQLARFERPEDIFKTHVTNGPLNYWTLQPAVIGYEIVVASSNNKAVENISQDLPRTESLATDWQSWIENEYGRESKDYAFRQLAEELLKSDGKKEATANKTDDDSPSAWALLAATLGNATNKSKFIGPFESRFIRERLNLSNAEYRSANHNWREARKAFKSALQKEAELCERREAAFIANHDPSDLLRAQERLKNDLGEVQICLQKKNRDLDTNREQAQDLQLQLNESCRKGDEAINAWQEAEIFYNAHQQYWATHFFESLIHFKKRKEDEKSAYIAKEQARLKKQNLCDTANSEYYSLARLNATINTESSEVSMLSTRESNLSAQLNEVNAKLEDYQNRPKHISTLSDERLDWIDQEWNTARTELFMAALRLHQQLVIGAVQQFRENLTLACKVMQQPRHFDQQAQLAAWQSLFLVVPVISSSFASVSGMFRGLGKESLGWAIIDEAGQATPQSAAGLLQRVHHAVAVGDPMQLEPIDTLPAQMRELLADTHNIVMGRESHNVQEMVDHQTRYGLEAEQWVGMPLVVHRRCEEPMFSICNEMAYSGRMVRAGAEHTPCLYMAGTKEGIAIPPSCWYDIPAGPDEIGKNKWRLKEGHELYARLTDLIEGGIAPEQILVIAPFKVGANKVQDIFRSALKQSGHYSHGRAAELAANQAGTVHTSQGREADIVFLVMGSTPGKPGCGSRDWVNSSPNMLNVAVSRAKRRLYVIGNVRDWESGKYSEYLIRSLPIRNPS